MAPTWQGVLGGLDGARITKRITSSRVDIRDVLMLVLHQFLWLFVRLSIHVTAQTRSDRMRRLGVCVYVHRYPIGRNWHG